MEINSISSNKHMRIQYQIRCAQCRKTILIDQARAARINYMFKGIECEFCMLIKNQLSLDFNFGVSIP
jgi:hypothetical protein